MTWLVWKKPHVLSRRYLLDVILRHARTQPQPPFFSLLNSSVCSVSQISTRSLFYLWRSCLTHRALNMELKCSTWPGGERGAFGCGIAFIIFIACTMYLGTKDHVRCKHLEGGRDLTLATRGEWSTTTIILGKKEEIEMFMSAASPYHMVPCSVPVREVHAVCAHLGRAWCRSFWQRCLRRASISSPACSWQGCFSIPPPCLCNCLGWHRRKTSRECGKNALATRVVGIG